MVKASCPEKGSLSVEFLVALTVMASVLVLSARIVFGLQDVVSTKDRAAEGRSIVEDTIASARAFSGPIQNLPISASAPAPFTLQRIQQFSTLCSTIVTDRASWSIPKQASTELSTTVTSLQSVDDSGMDCPVVGLSGVWNTPRIVSSSVLGLSRIQVHGVDVIQRASARVVVLVGTSTQVSDPDLFLVDVTNSAAPILLSSLQTGNGLFAIDVAGSFAYVVQNSSTLQLQVINISNPSSPVLASSRSLPSATGSFPEGRSVFVFRNRVYVGTYETAGSEFYIFDMNSPTNPVFLGSKAVNHSVRNIIVREEIINGVQRLLAYIASSANATELQVLDVTDAAHITDFSSFDAQGGGSATALFPAGPVLWLARQQVVGEPTVIAISVSDPLHPKLVSAYDLKLRSGSVINGLVSSNALLVMTTTDSAAPFIVCRVSDLYAVMSCSRSNIFTSPGRIDYQDNLLFIPSANNSVVVGN